MFPRRIFAVVHALLTGPVSALGGGFRIPRDVIMPRYVEG